ncbi:flavin reductase family protein [Rhodococcus koreensis]
MTVTTIEPQYMRRILGHFCSGITVITASTPDGPIGFTCQSFTSLSLDPPLVCFCPARTSATWPRIREIGTFAVNVLADRHDGVSNGFARTGADKFADVAWTPGAFGAPVLDGVIAHMECRLWAEYDGGDHTIVTAEVLDLHASQDENPLLYFQGAYRHLRPRNDSGVGWSS